MDDSTWSDNPNAPQIPRWLYFVEKTNFAGFLIGTILYGVVIILFFQCIKALFSAANRLNGKIRNGHVAYSVMVFSFVTVSTAINLNNQSISYIDDRNFPGEDSNNLPPGPLGYQSLIYTRGIIPIMIVLNNLLANGFFLYRYSEMHPKNGCAILVPGIIFFLSVVMGLLNVASEASQPDHIVGTSGPVTLVSLAYYPLASALSVLTALMIVMRLVTHRKNIRDALRVSTGATGCRGALSTILAESSSLYVISFVLYIVPWYMSSGAQYIFLPILAQTQVIAPLLVMLRIADGSALTRDTITFKDLGPLPVTNEEQTTSVDKVPSGWYPATLVDAYGKNWALGLKLLWLPSMVGTEVNANAA